MTAKLSSKPDHGAPIGSTEDSKQVSASEVLQIFLDDLVLKLDTLLGDQGPILPSYTVSTLPPALPAGGNVFVTDETGGAVPAFSDGINWRRYTDRAIVS